MKRLIPWITAMILTLGILGCGDSKDVISTEQNSESVSKIVAKRLLELNLTEDEKSLIEQIDESIDAVFEPPKTRTLTQEETQEENTTVLSVEDRAEAYHSYGVLFGVNAYSNLAEYYFLKAVESEPNNPLYLSEAAAIIAASHENLEEAKPFIDATEHLNPEDPTVQLTLASYYDLLGEGEAALSHYRDAANLNKGNPLLRRFFFEALAEYRGLGVSLFQLRQDTMSYCERVLGGASNIPPNRQDVMDFIDERLQESIQSNTEISNIFSNYRGEHLTTIYTVWKDMLSDFFEEWNRENGLFHDQIFEELEEDLNDYQMCMNGCQGFECACGCMDAWLSAMGEYASGPVKGKIHGIVNTRVPQAIIRMSDYENFVLNYMLENIAQKDVESLSALTRFLYADYQLSCASTATNYLNTIYPYQGIYQVIETFQLSMDDCPPPREYPTPEEEDRDKLEKEMAKRMQVDFMTQVLLSINVKVCMPSLYLTICMGLQHGIFELGFSSGPVSMSVKRDIIHNRGVGASLGLGASVGDERLASVDVGTKLHFDAKGEINGVSVDSEVKAFGGNASFKKGKLFLYKRKRFQK